MTDADIRSDGDHRKALVAELFTRRTNTAHTRRSAVIDAYAGVPQLYPLLFGDDPVDAAEYRAALAGLDH